MKYICIYIIHMHSSIYHYCSEIHFCYIIFVNSSKRNYCTPTIAMGHCYWISRGQWNTTFLNMGQINVCFTARHHFDDILFVVKTSTFVEFLTLHIILGMHSKHDFLFLYEFKIIIQHEWYLVTFETSVPRAFDLKHKQDITPLDVKNCRGTFH